MIIVRICVHLFYVAFVSCFCLQFTGLWGAWCLVPGLVLLVLFARYDYRLLTWEMQRQQQQQQQQQQRSHTYRQGQQHSSQQAYQQAQQRGQQYTQAWMQQQKGQPQVYPVDQDELDRLMAYDYIDSLC